MLEGAPLCHTREARGMTHFSSRPPQQPEGAPKDHFVVLARPPPGGHPQQAGVRFVDHRIVEDQGAPSHRAQRAPGEVEECVPRPRALELRVHRFVLGAVKRVSYG